MTNKDAIELIILFIVSMIWIIPELIRVLLG